MSYDWAQFLQLAEGLQSQPDLLGPLEASLRSATSRAYYAALQCALGFARQEGFEPSSLGSIHHQVPDYFRRGHGPHGSTRKKIALELSRLRSRRNEADYDNRLPQEASIHAQLAVGMAQSILMSLRALSNGKQ